MRLLPRLAAIAAACLLASPALAQPVALQSNNNLSDVASPSASLANLGITLPLPASQGGTGQTSLSGLCSAISCLPTTGGTLTGALTAANLTLGGSLYGLGGVLLESSASPTIASGFGTSPSILAANGTAAFAIKIGTGGAASSGVLTMPAARTGWACQFQDVTTHSALVAFTFKTAGTTTSVSLANYTDVLALGSPWAAGDVIEAQCAAY